MITVALNSTQLEVMQQKTIEDSLLRGLYYFIPYFHFNFLILFCLFLIFKGILPKKDTTEWDDIQRRLGNFAPEEEDEERKVPQIQLHKIKFLFKLTVSGQQNLKMRHYTSDLRRLRLMNLTN